MAGDFTAAAMQPLDSTPLGTLSGALQGGVNNLANMGSNLLDRFFPPPRRAELKAKLSRFATEKPMLASFLLSQVALSAMPIALFVTMTIGIFVFALLAALVIAVVGALLFTVFCVGVALLVLLPTLFVTTFTAGFIWLWGIAAYYIIKWFNQKPVPGIHTTAADGVMEQTGLGGIKQGITDVLTGDKKLPPEHEQDPSHRDPPEYNEKQNGVEKNGHQEQPHTAEKKEVKHQPPKLGPSAAKTHVTNATKTTGVDIEKFGGDLKKKTSGLGGITGVQGIVA